MALFQPFWGYQKWHFGCPNQNSETTFQYKLAPKTPKKEDEEDGDDGDDDDDSVLSTTPTKGTA